MFILTNLLGTRRFGTMLVSCHFGTDFIRFGTEFVRFGTFRILL